MTGTRLPRTACTCLLYLLWTAPSLAAPQITHLGAPPSRGEPLMSQAQAVSDDGAVVAGYSLIFDPVRAHARQVAFVWRKQSGMQPLPYLRGGGNMASAQSVSADGKVVVGMSDGRLANGQRFWLHATRWRLGEPPQDLGTLPGAGESAATSVAGDGQRIVGYSRNRQGELRAVLWQQDHPPMDLGTLGGAGALANAISHAGDVVVGVAHNRAQQAQAFVWRASTGMQALRALPGSRVALATGISADGKVAVGCSANQIENWFNPEDNPLRGVVWHLASGRQQEIVNTLGGSSTLPLAVADDGLSVVGVALDAHGEPHAFRWSPANGMTTAHALPQAQQMRYAKGLTGNGRFSVGTLAESDDAYLADWRHESQP